MNENFCIHFKDNYKNIKIILTLQRQNRLGFGNINLEIDDNKNYINIEYYDKINKNFYQLKYNNYNKSNGLTDLYFESNQVKISLNINYIKLNQKGILISIFLLNINV